MKVNKNFIGSRMNKSLDERLLKPGEYIDAMNIRISSPEGAEAGSAENAKGTEKLTTLDYNGSALVNPVCIGAFEDGENETIYWFVTSDTVDMIVSYNENTAVLTKHVVSTTVLNFSAQNLVNGVNLIDDLLFFTDNYNQPRKINVKRAYPVPVAGVDQIDEDDISVIVKPPIESPKVILAVNNSEENYIEDRFIRFAYRYKYQDGEYSALSEFSDLAFNPKGFRFDFGTFDNEGMLNRFNEARVTINTGNEKVVGVDVCFKQSNSNTVNVIDKYVKSDENWADNMEYTVKFSKQKIYTSLQDSEILRHFDNVPRLAKTQTTMGNRIIYGNYIDGYDIDTVVDYDVFGITENTQDEPIPTQGNNTNIVLDFTDIELSEGKTIAISLNLVSQGFSSPSYPGGENDFQDSWSFTLSRDYYSAVDLATSQEFIDAINLTDQWTNTDDNYSLTDIFFSSIVSHVDWNKVNGVLTNTTSQGGFTILNPSNDTVQLNIMGVAYEEISNPGVFVYEYFEYSSPSAEIFSDEQRKSLHSNRDFEVGIEYLDEYSRASTVLISENNSVFFDASTSSKKNSIRVKLNSLAPSWAKRYRFVLKPSKTSYETIFSSYWIPLDYENSFWLRLDGDNQTKAKVGDMLIVKKDSFGPIDRLIKARILDLKVMEEDELGNHPTGLYMKVSPQNYSLRELTDQDNLERYYTNRPTSIGGKAISVSHENPNHPDNGGSDASATIYRPFPIPIGSKVILDFRCKRGGTYDYDFGYRYEGISNNDYDSLFDFIKNENINFSSSSNIYVDSGALGGPTDNNRNKIVFNETLGDAVSVIIPSSFSPPLNLTDTTSLGAQPFVNDQAAVTGYQNKEREMMISFHEDASTGRMWMVQYVMNNAYNDNDNNQLSLAFRIETALGTVVFETEPLDNDSEIYFQSHNSYPITNRNHSGSLQDQDNSLSQPAITDLDLYDCFSFGNGVESFKIRDGLADAGFKIGSRVSSVSEQDYKEAKRYADVTYSGVYNEETNINRLNEFNLGLANFKTLEQSFGPINLLHGRQTDILALQEDKISYVLAGKNILSDAVGGGTLTSVPEVLGQQVSRVEEYGCSDMESFASYGGNVFFTDEKRGAVINLTGGNRNEQLRVISSFGMRSWFRDRFIENNTNIKLGAYDPYMDEYVLTFTDSLTAEQENNISCGQDITQYESSTPVQYTVDLGSGYGDSTMSYDVEQGSVLVSLVYNGSTVINQTVTGAGTIDFLKDDLSVDTATLTLTPTNATYTLSVGCVDDESLTIIRIVKNTQNMNELTSTHNSFWSPPGSNVSTLPVTLPVEFTPGPVSQYHTSTGIAGQGQFPTDGATVTMTYVGNINDTAEWKYDRFKYLVSDTLYTADQIDQLTPLLTTLNDVETSITYIPGVSYESEFTYNNPSGDRYLYLVWDYVEPDLECYSGLSRFTVTEEGRYETYVNLPNTLGDVTFTFDVGAKPARIQLTYVNEIVADSLFIGDDLPDATLESEITSLTGPVNNHEYIGDGEFAETFTINPSGPTFFTASDIAVSDGTETRSSGSGTGQIGVVADYPSPTALASDGQIKLTFNKNATGSSDIANQVKVTIWSANSGENTWTLTPQCPQVSP